MVEETAEQLERETLKWLSRAKEKAGTLEAVPGGDNFLENALAYISDARHFLEKRDLVRAFEAVVWAWAWLEIGEREGFLREKNKKSEE